MKRHLALQGNGSKLFAGIPRGVNAWSYLYTTAKDGAYGSEKRLAGHGVGVVLGWF